MRLTANGIDIHYQKTGSGPALLLLHGNGESLSIFKELAAVLSADFTVYALDSRCHGGSSKTDTISYGEMAEDTAAFIKALHLERPVLYGFSDGAITGMVLAAKYPGLLSHLVASGPNSSPAGLKKRLRLAFRLSHLCRPTMLSKLMLTQPNLTAGDLAAIQTPTLLVFGEKDITSKRDIAFMHQSIPQSALKILPGEGHGSYIVHSAKAAPLLREFILGQA